MSRKRAVKPYWEMPTAELREATKEFDEAFVAEQARPLTPPMEARWERAQTQPSRAEDDAGAQTIRVRLEKPLLARSPPWRSENASAGMP